MKKLLQKRGETLVESLVSILLVTFIMLYGDWSSDVCSSDLLGGNADRRRG